MSGVKIHVFLEQGVTSLTHFFSDGPITSLYQKITI